MPEQPNNAVDSGAFGDPLGDREMNLRFAGICSRCGREIPKGAKAIYSRTTKSVRHIYCSEIDFVLPEFLPLANTSAATPETLHA